MSAEVVIREARPEEREAVRALTLAAYAPLAEVMEPAAWAGLDGAVRAALRSEEAGVQRIVAERGGRLVGSVLLYPPASDAYAGAVGRLEWPELRLLAVAEEARGAGIGRALVEECARRARAMGAADLGLHTSESMRAALRIYQDMGFRRAPEHDFQPEGAELVTAWRLGL